MRPLMLSAAKCWSIPICGAPLGLGNVFKARPRRALGRQRARWRESFREVSRPAQRPRDGSRHRPGCSVLSVRRHSREGGPGRDGARPGSARPLLDFELAQFVLGLPWRMRFKDGQLKPLLKDACSPLWPEQLKSREKQGFGGPITNWIQRPEVVHLIRRVTAPGSPLLSLLPARRRYLSDAGQIAVGRGTVPMDSSLPGTLVGTAPTTWGT